MKKSLFLAAVGFATLLVLAGCQQATDSKAADTTPTVALNSATAAEQQSVSEVLTDAMLGFGESTSLMMSTGDDPKVTWASDHSSGTIVGTKINGTVSTSGNETTSTFAFNLKFTGYTLANGTTVSGNYSLNFSGSESSFSGTIAGSDLEISTLTGKVAFSFTLTKNASGQTMTGYVTYQGKKYTFENLSGQKS